MKALINTLLVVLCLGIFSCGAITPDELEQQFKDIVLGGDSLAIQNALAKGADIHTDDDWALRWAAKNGDLALVSFLVHSGANVHVLNELPLRSAANRAYWDVAIYLILHGAEQNKLTAEQIEQMRNSVQAQQRIAIAIGSAFISRDWQYLKKIISIMPCKYLEKKTRDQLIINLASFIDNALLNKNLSELSQLLDVIPFDDLPNKTQVQIREFTQQRELHGLTKKRKTKYS